MNDLCDSVRYLQMDGSAQHGREFECINVLTILKTNLQKLWTVSSDLIKLRNLIHMFAYTRIYKYMCAYIS